MRALLILLTLAVLCLRGTLTAQPNITAVEYFFDTDPGAGNGTAVTISAGPQVTTTFTPNTAGLSFGFHTLNVRARDADGKWGHTSIYRFHHNGLSTQPVSTPQILAGEFFLNTDPGHGAASPITVTPAVTLTGTLNLDLSGLSPTPGLYTVGIRFRDANGNWTGTRFGIIRVEGLTVPLSTPPDITRIEYFISPLAPDPGLGLAMGVPFATATTVSGLNFTVDVSSLALGSYILNTRAQDANGRWSMTQLDTFLVEASPLPVTWLALSAQRVAGGAEVLWSTASEVNTDYFVVERRVNAGAWADIGRAAAAGTSTATRRYAHLDPDAPTGADVDYRLRQVDLDGRYSHSPLVRLDAQATQSLGRYVLYPNPAEASQVQLVALGAGPADAAPLTLTVLSASGATLTRLRVSPAQLTATLRAVLANQATGLYALRLEGPQGAELHRLLLR